MKSIRSKIIILVLLSIITVASLIGYILISRSYNAFQDVTEDKLEEMVSRYASEFNHDLSEVETTALSVELLLQGVFDFQALHRQPTMYMDELEETIAPIIKRFAENGKRTQSAYIFFLPEIDGTAHDVWYSDLNKDGYVTRQEEFPLSFYDSFDPTEEWFFVPKESGKPYWTDPYNGNAEYDKHITYISHTRPVYVDNRLIGIAGSDYYFNLMQEDVSAIRVYETGYAFLANEKMEVLIHPTLAPLSTLDTEYKGKYRYLNDEFRRSNSGIIHYTWLDNKSKILVFQRLNNGWTFGLTIEQDEALGWITDLSMFMFFISLIFVVVTGTVAYKFTGFVINDLTLLTDKVHRIGNGDYDITIPMKLIVREDETGKLANSIEQMRVRQKMTFEQILKNNETLESEIENRTHALRDHKDYLERALKENELKNEELLQLNKKMESIIQEMELTQRQLIESEKMASLSFMVTKLSHEFNTPIGNCTTLMSFLKEEKEKIQAKFESNTIRRSDLTKFLEKYYDSHQMMVDNLTILKQLVSRFKELDPSTHVTVRSKVHMKQFVEVVINSINMDFGHVGVEVLCDPDLIVELDSGKLSQVFFHLIENALVHGFQNLKSGLIIIDIKQKEEQLYIRVHDNGSGIPPEMMDHIFVPFYSGSLSDTSSGLGLNIVYNIVTTIFDGHISCSSHLGEGTEFMIVINLE